jgi:nitroimidazol reductase NimA-like FMN-containing flavoprotein (pyridoxamine 5'-phosphate oxidase superfamily)
MRRKDKEISDPAAIDEIIRKALICRIALCDGGEPYLVPVNFGYESGCIYVHSAPEGKKIDLIRKNARVCFEMEADVGIVPAPGPCKWSMKYRSVIGFGRARILESREEKRNGLLAILKRYMEGPFDFPAEALERVAVIKIEIDSMSGKSSGSFDS